MNTTIASLPANSTAQSPIYSTSTASPEVPQVFSYTAPVSPQAPVMNSTPTPPQTPQELAQNPMNGVVSFLMNPDQGHVQSVIVNQTPVISVLQKILSLFGITTEEDTPSALDQQALLTLKNMIQQARPDFLALKNQVSQFIEQTIQGQTPNNPVLQQALIQAQAIFKDAIKESGGLVQFLNKPEAKEALNQIVSSLIYQSQVVTSVYNQLKSSPQMQALVQNDPLSLNAVLNSLHTAAIHHGAPAPLAKFTGELSEAILQMVQTILKARNEFANAMGMNTLGDSRTVHPSVLKGQPVSNEPA